MTRVEEKSYTIYMNNLLMMTFSCYFQMLGFIPAHFSIILLLKTFFSPWKRIFWKKTRPGFNLEEFSLILVSNMFSRLIGACLRTFIIFLGIFVELSFIVVGLPLVVLVLLIGLIFKRDFSTMFKRENLDLIPPIAYDWHFGYTPTLDKYGVTLSEKTIDKNYFKLNLIGREREIAQIKRILFLESQNNVLLVGEPGLGRHAVLYHLTKSLFIFRFVHFDILSLFKDKKTTVEQKGALEEILAESKAAGNIVLVIEDFEKYIEYTPVWERYIQGRGLYVIGITTPDAFHQIIFPNKILMKDFTAVEIETLKEEQILVILKNLVSQTENAKLIRSKIGVSQYLKIFSGETILSLLLNASYKLVDLQGKSQPEAAIDLLEEFFSYLNIKVGSLVLPKDELTLLSLLDNELKLFLEEKIKAPVGDLKTGEREKLVNLEELLSRRIISQNEAITEIANALRRRRLNLTNAKKPIGSFLFLGPTGVGKTETAKALAQIFFGEEKFLLRFDMARFQNISSLEEFISELADKIREQPYGVLLLDEIEKANHELLNILLTIIDEGYFHDQNNNRVPASNLIIIGTSNAGAEFIRESILAKKDGLDKLVVEYLLQKGIFAPEFLNRFDGVIVYHPLEQEDLKKIAQMKLEVMRARIEKEHQKTFTIDDNLLEEIIREGTHPEFGARELDRTIARLVENKLAKEILT